MKSFAPTLVLTDFTIGTAARELIVSVAFATQADPALNVTLMPVTSAVIDAFVSEKFDAVRVAVTNDSLAANPSASAGRLVN